MVSESPDSTPRPRVSRRSVLKLAALGAAAVTAGGGSAVVVTRLGRCAPRPYRFFTETEAALLIDICEQLIRRDDAPGATDAGVIHYIDRQLSGPFASQRESYRRGLAAFRHTCQAEFKADFAQLSADRKIEALRRVESGKAPAELWRDPTAPQFFRLVLAHTMQGFYGPARHGGNRDYVSYRMLGLDYPQVIGQNRYPKGGA